LSGWRLALLLTCLAAGLSIKFGLKRPESRVALAAQPANHSYDPSSDPDFQEAVKLRQSGKFLEAERAFDRLAKQAGDAGQQSKQARMLLGKAGAQLRRFAYQEASETYQRLLELAAQIGDDRLRGAVFVNLAELHIQLGDLDTAEREADSAVGILERTNYLQNLSRAELQLGSIKAGLGQDPGARTEYRKAINFAAEAGDIRGEALAWLIFGQALAKRDDLADAEDAYLNAYQLSLLNHDPLLDTLRIKLAELELRKGNPAEALRRLDADLAQHSAAQLGFAEYQMVFDRAQMLAALSRRDEALQMYRKAVAAATEWRQEALPGEVANAASVQEIHKIYAEASDFIAEMALETHNPALARESLEILATNRAADLREQRTLAWHRNGKLPPRYYQLLNQLRTAEASVILDGARKTDLEGVVRQTRADLALLETQLAMESEKSVASGETFESQQTLEGIQRALADSDALFSFNLGEHRSWLWAVSNRSVNLYRLPDGPALERASSLWAAQIRSGQDTSAQPGVDLARALFAQVPSAIFKKRNWLVVNDGTLFLNVPLAALPDLYGEQAVTVNGKCSAPLVQNHTVRYLSSEFSLSTNHTAPGQKILFAGIGDPVYNLADARYQGARTVEFNQASYSPATTLARLVGSGKEVRDSASVFPQAELLTGPDARTENLQQLLESKPAVIHLAVHVVSPADRPEEAALALSLGKDKLPELLTSELISTYRVPSSLVVMSGCDSEQGRAVPGVGVKGLSRAWLLAGASAVVASTWPMPDDEGQFFQCFYRHLEAESKTAASMPAMAASALAGAQNEMRASNGLRHNPAFWAAYTVISKE
jgi:CHAT domain-containing protein